MSRPGCPPILEVHQESIDRHPTEGDTLCLSFFLLKGSGHLENFAVTGECSSAVDDRGICSTQLTASLFWDPNGHVPLSRVFTSNHPSHAVPADAQDAEMVVQAKQGGMSDAYENRRQYLCMSDQCMKCIPAWQISTFQSVSALRRRGGHPNLSI